MIRRASGDVEKRRDFSSGNVLVATWKDGPIGLLESSGAVTSLVALGDASRGALYLALWPAASTWGEPVATTPRAAGSLRSFWWFSPRVRRCVGRAGPRARRAPRARRPWRRRARPRSGRPRGGRGLPRRSASRD